MQTRGLKYCTKQKLKERKIGKNGEKNTIKITEKYLVLQEKKQIKMEMNRSYAR